MENGWIDITDRIPPVGVSVLIRTKFGHEYQAFLRMDGQFQELNQNEHSTIDSVYAWKVYA